MNNSNYTPSESCNSDAGYESAYVLATVYILLVVVGLLGNASVIGVILKLMCNKGLLTNVYLYVLCLSTVDFVYLASGPFTIYHMINGTWAFGDALCKIVYVCEGLNKTLSVYILVILTFDRYLAACRPYTSAKYRSMKMAITGLALAAVTVSVTNGPIYVFTSVKPYPDKLNCYTCQIWFPEISVNSGQQEPFAVNSFIDDGNNVTVLLFNKSININHGFAPPSRWRSFHTYYVMFLLLAYFVLPGSLILTFYARIVKRLREQYRLVQTTPRKNSAKRNRVAKSVLIVVSFYFTCWTPYWLWQCLITFWPSVWMSLSPSMVNAFVYLSLTIYTLPYVNSCSNPVFYAFLNKRLRAAYASTHRRSKQNRRRSSGNQANSVIDENESTARTFL